MSEIKLNTWTWGVVPELPREAVLAVSSVEESGNPSTHWWPTYVRDLSKAAFPNWYAILSLGPPEMPEEELRLPVGWMLVSDTPYPDVDRHAIEIAQHNPPWPVRVGLRDMFRIIRPTRAECVREINRLLEGK